MRKREEDVEVMRENYWKFRVDLERLLKREKCKEYIILIPFNLKSNLIVC